MNARHKALKIRHIPIKEVKANLSKQDNAKVKVQYIQNHRTIEKGTIRCSEPAKRPTKFPVARQDDPEAENIEYLDDESTSEEQPIQFLQSCESKTEGAISKPMKKLLKDTFYPNAIHCLIDLYKRKYVELKGKTEQQIRSMGVWDEITENMNECLFRFSRNQIKEKFKQLRQQYFEVTTLQEADEFEYFDQLHDLYQDKYIDAIAAGFFKREESTEKQLSKYLDEVLLREDDPEDIDEQEIQNLHLVSEENEHNYEEGTAQEVVMDTNVDEIAHKEHEFIDMVEKELQAIVGGGGNGGEETQEICNNELIVHQQEEIFTHEDVAIYTTVEERSPESQSDILPTAIKREQQETEETTIESQNNKRFKADTESYEQPKNIIGSPSSQTQTQHRIMNKAHSPISSQANAPENAEMTLADYNIQQERRHQEKLELLQKSLLLQERAIEMHRNLMEELIKRL